MHTAAAGLAATAQPAAGTFATSRERLGHLEVERRSQDAFAVLANELATALATHVEIQQHVAAAVGALASHELWCLWHWGLAHLV
jgi:hypothetical protein